MNTKKRVPKERGYQKRAFEIYCVLGEKRSYAAVAETLGMSTSTIKHWARRFDWRARLNRRITWQANDTPERTDRAQIEQFERAIKFLDAALARHITPLVEGDLKASPQDLMALHRLEEQLLDRVNQRSGIQGKTQGVRIIIPDNCRDGPDKNAIPKSQLKEYLDYLDYRT